MKAQDWIMVLFMILTDIIGFLLLLRDMKRNDKKYLKAARKTDSNQENFDGENITEGEGSIKFKISKSVIIYSVIMTCISIAVTVFLQKFYVTNSFLFNLKRVCLLSVLAPLAYTDYKSYRIPNEFILLGICYRLILIPFEFWVNGTVVLYTVLSDIIASAALFAASVLCKLCIKNAIGAGDIKLFFVMGLMLSLNGIWAAIFMSLIVSFFICVYLLVTKKKGRKDIIPFAPAIVIGTYLSVFLTGM